MTHGTRRDYQRGCRCTPCRAAEAAYRSSLRRLRASGKQPLGAKVSAVDTWRKIRQFKSEQFTQAEIARRLGLQSPQLQFDRKRITLATSLKVARFYRLVILEGQDGPNAPL